MHQVNIEELYDYCNQFLGAFVKFLEVTISFVMSVRPFVCMEQLGPHWMDFRKI
jgi:hypothetical protein